MQNKIIRRFQNYVRINSQSNEKSSTVPSTVEQMEFAKKLKEELSELGLFNISLDSKGYLMAGLPSNCSSKEPVIGLLAHMDTSPDFTAENVNPQIKPNYDGNDILLNSEENIILSPEDFPELKNYIGNSIICTDGKTLLGADDKAGIAIIITAIEYLLQNPQIKHGEIRIAFTPDEEIGKGANHFDVKKFGADFAYTLDGGEIGELEFENFNAAMAKLSIQGRNVHPGTAKGKMINAGLLASEFISLLPEYEKPEHTDGYEGFFHVIEINATVEQAELRFLIRDHSNKKFKERKQQATDLCKQLKTKYKKANIQLQIEDQYYNMKEKIEPVYHIVERAKKSMTDAGIKPIIKPIRGGTDGARLSFMGLPTPNIFTGGHNYHGRYEYIPLESMIKAVEVVVGIVRVEE